MAPNSSTATLAIHSENRSVPRNTEDAGCEVTGGLPGRFSEERNGVAGSPNENGLGGGALRNMLNSTDKAITALQLRGIGNTLVTLIEAGTCTNPLKFSIGAESLRRSRIKC